MGVSYNLLIRPLAGPQALIFAAVFAVSNIVAVFATIIDNVLFGDLYARHPFSHMFAMVGLSVCTAILIDRFAYSRIYKIKWELGWLFFVHLMIWGRQWMTGQ